MTPLRSEAVGSISVSRHIRFVRPPRSCRSLHPQIPCQTGHILPDGRPATRRFDAGKRKHRWKHAYSRRGGPHSDTGVTGLQTRAAGGNFCVRVCRDSHRPPPPPVAKILPFCRQRIWRRTISDTSSLIFYDRELTKSCP